jgi:hypothetical protein
VAEMAIGQFGEAASFAAKPGTRHKPSGIANSGDCAPDTKSQVTNWLPEVHDVLWRETKQLAGTSLNQDFETLYRAYSE